MTYSPAELMLAKAIQQMVDAVMAHEPIVTTAFGTRSIEYGIDEDGDKYGDVTFPLWGVDVGECALVVSPTGKWVVPHALRFYYEVDGQ